MENKNVEMYDDVLWENWIISNGDIDEFIRGFQHLKEEYTKKGYTKILLMNPKDLQDELFTYGRPKDIPLHTSFFIIGKK